MKFTKDNIIETIGIVCGGILVSSVAALAVAAAIKLITLMF